MELCYYILVNGQIKKVDLMAWVKWFETADRTIASTDVRTPIGEFWVSTVFLSLDYNYSDNGDPILFETMVFQCEHELEMYRYSTLDEALAGHERLVGAVQRMEIWPERAGPAGEIDTDEQQED